MPRKYQSQRKVSYCLGILTLWSNLQCRHLFSNQVDPTLIVSHEFSMTRWDWYFIRKTQLVLIFFFMAAYDNVSLGGKMLLTRWCLEQLARLLSTHRLDILILIYRKHRLDILMIYGQYIDDIWTILMIYGQETLIHGLKYRMQVHFWIILSTHSPNLVCLRILTCYDVLYVMYTMYTYVQGVPKKMVHSDTFTPRTGRKHSTIRGQPMA